jgi:aminodeoxyfutalosine synthase
LGTALLRIFSKVEEGKRLSYEDGVTLYRSNDVVGLGRIANLARERKNGEVAYYIVNRHINYSNICKNRCRFCAFSRTKGEQGAFEMTMPEVLRRAEEGVKQGATELHIVGGLHPELKFEFYLNMLREMSRRFPKVHLQCFTAVEIAHMAELARLSLRETLAALKEAGLGSIPGGGAEVFAPRVRQELCPEKLSPEGWLDVMREAHSLGIRANATMLYGHIETPEERVAHMLRLREVQDETGGFMTFIPLAFHPRNTPMAREGEKGAKWLPTTAFLDLKTLAIGRLMLDNFEHVKSFWIMLGMKLAQVSLAFGVDDIDGTVVEERIAHMAGAETPETLSVGELCRMIVEAGRRPVERNTVYQRILRPSETALSDDWTLSKG